VRAKSFPFFLSQWKHQVFLKRKKKAELASLRLFLVLFDQIVGYKRKCQASEVNWVFEVHQKTINALWLDK
jgi:hypothetical protein